MAFSTTASASPPETFPPRPLSSTTPKPYLFRKKTKPLPLQISSPLNPSALDRRSVYSPRNPAYSIRTPHPGNLIQCQTPQYYKQKSFLRPKPKRVPTFIPTSDQVRQLTERSSTAGLRSPLSPSRHRWFRLITGKRRLLKNRGMDGHGRFKLEFEDLTDADWGVPDEWR